MAQVTEEGTVESGLDLNNFINQDGDGDIESKIKNHSKDKLRKMEKDWLVHEYIIQLKMK